MPGVVCQVPVQREADVDHTDMHSSSDPYHLSSPLCHLLFLSFSLSSFGSLHSNSTYAGPEALCRTRQGKEAVKETSRTD